MLDVSVDVRAARRRRNDGELVTEREEVVQVGAVGRAGGLAVAQQEGAGQQLVARAGPRAARRPRDIPARLAGGPAAPWLPPENRHQHVPYGVDFHERPPGLPTAR